MSPSEPLSSALLRHRAVFIATAGVIVLLGIVPEFLNPIIKDNAWLLSAAGRFLNGSRLYVDVIETTPPLIIWLNAIPAAVARGLGISPILVFRLAVVALALLSVGLCRGLLTRILGPGEALRQRYLILLLLFVLFPLSRDDFGQREHLFLCLVLPYLLLTVCRAERKAVAAWTAAGVGLLAGIGMGIKPFFFLLWIALETWLRFSARAGAPTRRPENLAIAMTGLLYALAVVLWAPEYLEFVHLLGGSYYRLVRMNVWEAALLADGVWLAWGAILTFLVLRHAVKFRALWAVLVVATAVFLLAGILQQKGWRHHFYPALSLGMVIFGGLAVDHPPRLSSLSERLFATIAAAATLTMVGTTTIAALTRTLTGLNWRKSYPDLQVEVAFVRARAGGGRLLVLDCGECESELALYTGADPVSRFPFLWPLIVTYGDALRSSRPFRYHEPAEMDQAERYLLRAAIQDFERGYPDLLLIPAAPDRPVVRYLDFLQYFTRDPIFARLFSRYTFIGEIGAHEAYQPLAPGATRVPPPPRPDLRTLAPATAGEHRSVLRASIEHRQRRAAVFLVLLGVLILWELRGRPEGTARISRTRDESDASQL